MAFGDQENVAAIAYLPQGSDNEKAIIFSHKFFLKLSSIAENAFVQFQRPVYKLTIKQAVSTPFKVYPNDEALARPPQYSLMMYLAHFVETTRAAHREAPSQVRLGEGRSGGPYQI